MSDETKKTTTEEEVETEVKETEVEEAEIEEEEEKEESKEKSFSQSQVNKMMAKEKRQGKNAAFKELGIDPKDEKTVKMLKAFVKSQNEGKGDVNDKNDYRESEAEKRATIAEAKLTAINLGVKPKYAEDVVTLAMSKMSKDEDSDMESIISEFKIKYPNWFGLEAEDEDGKKGGEKKKQGTGSSVKPDSDKGGKQKGLGERLAAQRNASKAKKSYWD